MDKNRELLDHMASFCKFAFSESGQVLPMWLLEDEAGQIQPVLTPFGDSASKDAMIAAIRQAIRDHKAVRCGFMSEAWALIVKKGHPDFDNPTRIAPSEHPDRREIVKLMVEDKDGGMLFAKLFILRPEHGKPSLSPISIEEGAERAGGRFTGLFQKA